MNALEQSKTPFVIRDILIEQAAAGGGGGGAKAALPAAPSRTWAAAAARGGGQRPSDGSVRVTMQVDSYIFEKVHVWPDEEKKIDEKMPKPTPPPPPTMAPTMPPGGAAAAPTMRTPRADGSPSPGAESRPAASGSSTRMGRPSPEAMARLNAHRAEIEQMMKEKPAKAQEYIKQLMEGGGQ